MPTFTDLAFDITGAFGFSSGLIAAKYYVTSRRARLQAVAVLITIIAISSHFSTP